MSGLSPDIFPASLAQNCLYLHDAQCILDRPDDALRHAKLARQILENVDFFEPQFTTREEVDNMEINTFRGEAVASHNLGLDRKHRIIINTPRPRLHIGTLAIFESHYGTRHIGPQTHHGFTWLG